MMEKILNILIRFVIKPMLSSKAPLWLQRFAGVLSSFVLRKAPNCTTKRIVLGSCPTLLVSKKEKTKQKQEQEKSQLHVLYLHGGAYVMGGISSHSKLATWISHTLCAEVWLPEYSLSPEHTFPVARNQLVACYQELLDSGISSENIIIMGDSAGGGLTLTTAIAIRDAGIPQPAALVLISPWVDLTLSGSTMQTHINRDNMLSMDWLTFGATSYAGCHSISHPECSPLFADLADLPPMLIQVGTEEILLDDAKRLAEKATNAGVETALEEYANMGHVFQLTAGHVATANRALKAMAAFCKEHHN